MDVLALADRADPDLGLVGARLLELGSRIEHAWREDEWWDLRPERFDLVVSLGSESSVYDPEMRPSVEREADLLRRGVAEGVPVLAVCYGAQLLAYALGGRVVPAEVPEIGWFPVRPLAGSDPQLDPGPYLQWHRDRFDPPPGAVVLADSRSCCQAFRSGSALAVQFHPEATTEMIERWAAAGRERLDEDGLDGRSIVAETARRQPEAATRAAVLVDMALADAATSTIGSRVTALPSMLVPSDSVPGE